MSPESFSILRVPGSWNSSGIGVLLNRYKQMKAGHTGFYGACPQVMRVLKVAGILGLMHQYESKEEAIYSREV